MLDMLRRLFRRTASATYDRVAEVLSVKIRNGEPKYVITGSGTIVIYADERGIYAIDFEAVSWDREPQIPGVVDITKYPKEYSNGRNI